MDVYIYRVMAGDWRVKAVCCGAEKRINLAEELRLRQIYIVVEIISGNNLLSYRKK